MSTKSGIKLIESITDGTFDIYRLAGVNQRFIRQAIVEELTSEKLPLAKCGINAIADLMYHISKVQGTCRANADYKLRAWMKEQLA